MEVYKRSCSFQGVLSFLCEKMLYFWLVHLTVSTTKGKTHITPTAYVTIPQEPCHESAMVSTYAENLR